MTGVAAACYAMTHISLYVIQQNWRLAHVGSEIIHRPYLTIGLVAAVILVSLAATSTDAAVRSLGTHWKRLHRLVYLAATLATLHYVMQTKADISNATIVAGLLVWLLSWRLLPNAIRGRSYAPLLLMGIATVSTVIVEYAWYALATHVRAARILLANLQIAHLRPAAWVAIWSVCALLLTYGTRIVHRPNRDYANSLS